MCSLCSCAHGHDSFNLYTDAVVRFVHIHIYTHTHTTCAVSVEGGATDVSVFVSVCLGGWGVGLSVLYVHACLSSRAAHDDAYTMPSIIHNTCVVYIIFYIILVICEFGAVCACGAEACMPYSGTAHNAHTAHHAAVVLWLGGCVVVCARIYGI